MKKRPTSITVIAWILIVMSGISLITSTISLNNPMAKELMGRSLIPIPIQYAMMYVGLLITLIFRNCNAQRAELGKTSLCHLEYHWIRDWHCNVADEGSNDSRISRLSNCCLLPIPSEGQWVLRWNRGPK